MLKKEIVYCGQKAVSACDGNCQKAWGMNNRPTIQLDENDIDDYAYLSDDELGIAPINPGTYEGADFEAKPKENEEKLNLWCARECERHYLSGPGQFDEPIKLPDFSKRVYNYHHKNI